MTWKERRTITLLASILAILFAVLLVVLGIRYRQNRPDSQRDAAGAATHSSGTAISTSYTTISFSNNTATLTFTLDEEGDWVWADGPDFPLNSHTIEAIVDELSNLKFQQTLPASEGLESYGLSNPAATLNATDGQGIIRTIAFGKTTTDGDSYYIQMNGDESTVYIIADTLYQYMQTPIYDMCALPELPDLSEGNLVSLLLQGPVPAASEDSEGDGEAEAPEPPTTLLVARSSDENGAVLWFHGNDNVSSDERVSGIITDLGTLRLNRCVDFYPSDEAAEICGLDTPAAVLTATYGSIEAAQTFTLTVGVQSADGSGRYVRLNEEAPIYLLLTEYLDPLVSVAANGLTNS